MNQEKSKQPESVVDAELRQPRVYQPPKLVALGDVRDLTLGGSAGTGDSGGSGIQQF
ncbi:MAG: lasso RiPP family leader peptide-containing protein [Xanthomonadales bacterium]|nr:lasso RiPP family leader peptide-containing protein [Xanthomonadales bacterium]